MAEHVPVLLKEALEHLRVKKNSRVLDATADGGGSAESILASLGPRGKLLLLDWDPEMAELLRQKFGKDRRVKILNLNFRDLRKLKEFRPDAIFFDLGLSTLQLNTASGRGFSFQKDEPLLMTFHPETRPTAKEFIASAPEKELARVIWECGEERFSQRIARAICERRRKRSIETSKELAEIIAKAVGRGGRIHPATRTFQAIRIYINNELENLKEGLAGAWEILKPGGGIAAISFHSLEDRIVKNFFRDKFKAREANLITKKPITPGGEELRQNPRSRSAKLRVLEKR